VSIARAGLFVDRECSFTADMFHICQGTCMCASSEGGNKGKVLYCYGEVVLQRDLMRGDTNEPSEEEQTEIYFLQISQIVAYVVLILAILLVLLSIRKGLGKIQSQVKHILLTIPDGTNLDKPGCKTNSVWCNRDDEENRAVLYNNSDKIDSLNSVVSNVI